MNFLLRELQADGVMQHACIAVASQDQALLVVELNASREVFYMGDDVRPGPFWVVRAEDAPALEAAGFKRGN